MKIHGFTRTHREQLHDIGADAGIFMHDKSGARLLHLACDDPNKVFAVFFRTPPSDSTGVPHILEHSVLCGSRKFPSKEPFVALLKGSLKTFLNAFTFSDKTGYPVASKNDKDFFHLMDVYLDAVFNPNIYHKPEIFQQEGWHYELESPAAPLEYNGVVFNEMKGAFSSPEGILMSKIEAGLFPDTCYHHESGGDPDAIPFLTHEDFLDFHRRYYHPGNGYFFLYGNGNLEEQLAFLDREYLNRFDRRTTDSVIAPQPPFTVIRELRIPYPIAAQESPREKTYLTLNYATCRATDTETVMGLELLNTILLETPASPLKKALIEAGLGKDVFGIFSPEVLQPFFSIVLKNAEEDRLEDFRALVRSTLTDLVAGGIDQKLVEGAINTKEFLLREADFKGTPKGLVYCLAAMTSWLYDDSPLKPLQFEVHLAAIRGKMDNGYFEGLITRYLLNNTHGTCLVLAPQPGLAEEREDEEMARLEAYKAGLPAEAIRQICDRTGALKAYQAAPDRPEDLAAIPSLALTDIDPKPEIPPLAEKEAEVQTLFHDVATNGVVYCNMFFDTGAVPQSLIPYLGLLADILGAIHTERYHYTDLSNELNLHLGGISFHAGAYAEFRRRDVYHPKFSISAKTLEGKWTKLVELVEEIAVRSEFSDRKRLKELIQEIRSRLEMDLMHSGHQFAARRITAQLAPAAAYNELLEGISYYKFITDLDNNFDDKWQQVAANLAEVSRRTFSCSRLLLSLTAPERLYPRLAGEIETFCENLAPGETGREIYALVPPGNTNEAFTIPSEVHYVAKAGDFAACGLNYNARMLTLETILNTDYLWNNVRVMGGAYGCRAAFGSDGTCFLTSYRDPNLRETLRIYDQMGAFVRDLPYDRSELDKCIIGTIGRLDIPLTPSMKGEHAVSNYIGKVSDQYLIEERHAILATAREELTAYGEAIGEALAQGITCVIGGETAIQENKDLFDKVTPLIE